MTGLDRKRRLGALPANRLSFSLAELHYRFRCYQTPVLPDPLLHLLTDEHAGQQQAGIVRKDRAQCDGPGPLIDSHYVELQRAGRIVGGAVFPPQLAGNLIATALICPLANPRFNGRIVVLGWVTST